ncbi:phosphotransferase-like protein [Auraticoccus monumenti]|uniref:Chloramphenicol 3-O phosphotransferase n=1 Tax=Auraticoccus monumenti TaxID=675864 RepID=A0A1G6ZPP4_9ACTN|nr:AAA family ATPase [Auraticoccus monumenti]SDE04648.1 chloramphenicol 3-O phosphotransferase [Auraticoccus monumenti]
MPTPIVLLNGSPSAGKTTLAEALQRALPVPAFHLSLDEFLTGIRSEFWLAPTTPPLFSLMVRAYLRSMGAVADEGLMVIAEAIILPSTRELYEPLFARYAVTLIGVRCPLPLAQQRELRRGDRRDGPVDLDVPEFTAVHEQDYHLEVDTSVESTERSVDKIRGLLDTAL